MILAAIYIEQLVNNNLTTLKQYLVESYLLHRTRDITYSPRGNIEF